MGVAGASVSLPCSSYHSLYPTASTALLMWFHEANTDPFYRCVGFLLGIFLVSLNQNPCASKIVQRELRKGIKKLGLWQTYIEFETTVFSGLILQGDSPFKGIVSRDFWLLVFFMNQFSPTPEYPIRTIASQGSPPVSMTCELEGKNVYTS